jgi:deaminated glutathione amidase
MTPFAIAGVQMHISAAHENVTAMTQQIDLVMARFPWVQMVLFSELAPYGPLPKHAPEDLRPTEEVFREAARRHGIWLIPGTMFERAGERIYNTASVIDPAGEVVTRYRKMFPFMPYEAGIAWGREFCVFDVPAVGRFGLSICYDIWFPETTRTLVSMGAEVLLHPVLTGTIDRDVELSLARSTAAMFQCYVFDINGLGPGGTGRSCVADPAGHLLYQATAQEETIALEIDLDMVRRQRATGLRGLGQTLKSFRDRRAEFEVYDREAFDHSYLDALGRLEMPAQGSQAGIDVGPPANAAPLADDSRQRELHLDPAAGEPFGPPDYGTPQHQQQHHDVAYEQQQQQQQQMLRDDGQDTGIGTQGAHHFATTSGEDAAAPVVPLRAEAGHRGEPE